MATRRKPIGKPQTKSHPSGPKLPGHVKCPAGMIYDHASGHCIPMANRKSVRKKPYGDGVADIYG